jgi:type IV pilus assembly protein PilW
MHMKIVNRSMRGFTLVELMISVVIGLLTTLVIAEVLAFSEGQKRTTTAGSDAQINGAQGIYAIQREIKMAGYGFASAPALLGCPIYAKYNNANVASADPITLGTFANILAPVIITHSTTDPNRDSVRILSSAKSSYAIPIQVAAPGYEKTPSADAVFPVVSALGVRSGDLMIAAKSDATRCEVFKVSADPTIDTEIKRSDDTATWNPNQFPSTKFSFGDMLINMGSVMDHRYSISENNNLQLTSYPSSTPSNAPVPADIYADIVILQALYGKDTNNDGTVDKYDQSTPTTNSGWQEVLSIRLVLVARSAQYEKAVVTSSLPLWNIGSGTTVSTTPAATTCGVSKCLTLNIDATVGSDWQHYRYKVYDTVVPIMNLLWAS